MELTAKQLEQIELEYRQCMFDYDEWYWKAAEAERGSTNGMFKYRKMYEQLYKMIGMDIVLEAIGYKCKRDLALGTIKIMKENEAELVGQLEDADQDASNMDREIESLNEEIIKLKAKLYDLISQ